MHRSYINYDIKREAVKEINVSPTYTKYITKLSFMATIEQISDSEYLESIIKEVRKETNGYDITKEDGWSLWIDDVGIIPKKGDVIRIYGEGLGRPFRGIVIDGKVVFYRTKEEEKEHKYNLRNEQIKRDKKKFEHNKGLLNLRYSKLPKVFQNRIDVFRKNNPDFRWQHEAYEIFCNEQTLEIVKALKTVDVIDKFKELKWEKQKELVPSLSNGHSGNTFDFSIMMAKAYITNPELVEKQHGALCVLVGCENYGCQYGKELE